MVGRHNIDCVIIDGFAQCGTVCQCFDRRIPFDTVTEQFIIAVMEPKVMHADFPCNLLFAQRKLIA